MAIFRVFVFVKLCLAGCRILLTAFFRTGAGRVKEKPLRKQEIFFSDIVSCLGFGNEIILL